MASWTKEELVKAAFEELGIASYYYDVDTDTKTSIARRLDSMMASWSGTGVCLGFPMSDTPSDTSLSESSNLPDWATEAVFLNLAIRIAPMFGKQVQPETLSAAMSALQGIQYKTTMPHGVRTNPRVFVPGAGNYVNGRWTGIPQPYTQVDTGDDRRIEA